MYKVKNHSQVKINDLSVYMEIYNENQTVYRVTSAPTTDTSTNMVYGVEVENFKTSEKEYIYDFSDKLEKTVAFTEILIKNKNTPAQLYDIALNYLGTSLLDLF